MALLSVIRRWHKRQGQSIRAISKKTGLSRNTIKKYLAADTVEAQYPKRENASKLDEYKPTLISWLNREKNKPRKQRRTVKQLYEALIPLGYSGSYDRVAAFAREYREMQSQTVKGAFVPLYFPPGNAFQFDWSEDWLSLNGRKTKLYIAHFKLSHSRAFIMRAYYQQSHEMLFDAHNHAFRVFKGIPERGIYDNMKTAVDKVGRGKQRIINPRFLAMSSHYLYEPEFCNPAAGWEKGQIEKQVRDKRHQLLQQAPNFLSLTQLNDWLEQQCLALWKSMTHPEISDKTIEHIWQEEKAVLMAVGQAFDGYSAHHKKVSSTCLVCFDNNRYSVPAFYANKRITLKAYAEHVDMVADNQLIGTHPRAFNRDKKGLGKTVYQWQHYVPVLLKKPGALRNGAPFIEMPEVFKQARKYLDKHPKGDREMVDILALALDTELERLEKALSLCLEQGVVSKQQVLYQLSHLYCQDLKDYPIEPPAVLTLEQEPQANNARYDDLRKVKYVH